MAVIINSFISSALIVFLMYLDKYEKENITSMVKIFVITILFTGIYSVITTHIPYSNHFIRSVIFAPFLEELLKFLIFIMVWKIWKKELNESFDVVMYMGMIAVGFSFFENIAYYLRATQADAFFAAKTSHFSIYYESLFRIFVARLIPGHLLFDVIGISIIGFNLKKKQVRYLLIPAYFIAVLLHAIWNLLAGSIYLFPIYGGILIMTAFVIIRKLLDVSEYREDSEIGDDLKEYDKSRYDWSYYLLTYIFIIIFGVMAIFFAYYLGQLFKL